MVLLPEHPYLARTLGQQILLGEAHSVAELFRALAHQHHVAGILEYRSRKARHVLDVAYASDRTGAARWAVHAACIEFHHAILVRQPTQSDAIVVGIILLRLSHVDTSVQRVGAIEQHLVSGVE